MKDDFVDNIKIEDEPKNFYFQKAGKIYKITIFLLTDNISLIISETNKFSQIYGIKLNLKQIKANTYFIFKAFIFTRIYKNCKR